MNPTVSKLPPLTDIGTTEAAAVAWIEAAIRLRYPASGFARYRLAMNDETGRVLEALQRLDDVAPAEDGAPFD